MEDNPKAEEIWPPTRPGNPKAIEYDALTADRPFTEDRKMLMASAGEERARQRAILRGACIAFDPDAVPVAQPAAPEPEPDPDPTDDEVAAEQAAARAARDTLVGTDKLPALIPVGVNDKGRTNVVQLGYVVAQAHVASGLSVDDWNALEDDVRDQKLFAMVEHLKACNGELEAKPMGDVPTPTPATPEGVAE